MNFCPHCRSGNDPVLKDTTWSCGVKFNDTLWRTKECYKRQIHLKEQHIKRLEEAGDRLLELCEADESKFHLADAIDARCAAWHKAKEAKP